MTKEFRVFGPPGTGKTSALATKHIPSAVAKHGPEKVMVTSYTRTAAFEIATKKSRETGQTIDIPEQNVGTLHKICFHALGAPEIAEVNKEMLAEWNTEHPGLAITGKSISAVDEGATEDPCGNGSPTGDRVFNQYKILRNRLVPESMWPPDVKHFSNLWREHKNQRFACDFTDLIETCINNIDQAPGKPNVIFVDEAQDFTRLQMRLIRKWAQHMEYLVITGDDDQSLFEWAGGSPDVMIDPPIAEEFVRILKQSYRVPRAVLERSLNVIERVSRRQAKAYNPRVDRNGKVVEGIVRDQFSATWKRPDAMVNEIAERARAGESSMILASCKYMLDPLLAMLRSKGVPFENKYRRSQAAWNPLYRAKKAKTIGTVDILNAFLGNGIDVPYWNVPQFVTWASHLKIGEAGLKHKVGKKIIDLMQQAIDEKHPRLHTVRNSIHDVMTESAIERALARDLDWFVEHMPTSRTKYIDYPIAVIKNNGPDALENPPAVTVGTIHSVKGGEASSVYLFPDVSMMADAEMQSDERGHDAVYRMFYVGMTRAREELILCQPAIKNAYSARLFVDL